MSEARLWGWLSPDQPDPLSGKDKAEAFIAAALGLERLARTPPRPLRGEDVAESRLTGPRLDALCAAVSVEALTLDPLVRAEALLGQSYPDQLVRRSGHVGHAADSVVRPADAAEVAAVVAAAVETGFRIAICGGGTNVVGAFAPPDDERPLVALSMARMNRIIAIDAADRTVTAQAGVTLRALESRLAGEGLTLGHFPQSFEGATLGGSLAANGAGQRSDAYGRIADNLVSARVVTPSGAWSTETFPHAAAGPWLGGLLAGSEGLFGIVTDLTLRLRAKPPVVADEAWLVPDFATGIEAARALAQAEAGLAMVRVSDADETAFLSGLRHALAGRDGAPFAERMYLALKRAPANPCFVLAGAEGDADSVADALGAARAAMRSRGGTGLGRGPGESWRRGRYQTPFLREPLMARGLGVDTYETVAPWSRLLAIHSGVVAAVRNAAAATGVRAAVFCHLSHSYTDGACLYFTAVFARAGDELAQWRALKSAATEAILDHGGAVSHHHGLGADHAPWARRAMDPRGRAILAALKRELDPHGNMASGMAGVLT